jgi:hypothetical protein
MENELTFFGVGVSFIGDSRISTVMIHNSLRDKIYMMVKPKARLETIAISSLKLFCEPTHLHPPKPSPSPINFIGNYYKTHTSQQGNAKGDCKKLQQSIITELFLSYCKFVLFSFDDFIKNDGKKRVYKRRRLSSEE